MQLVVNILDAIGIRWQLVLAQLLGFGIVFLVLRHFLFGRVQQVLDDRAAEEERRRRAIAAARKESAAAKAKLDARTAEIEKQAYERTQTEVRAGLKRKSELVGAAIDKAREEVSAARLKIGEARAQALAGVRKDVVALTLFVVGRATGRKVEHEAEAQNLAEREVEAVLAGRTPEGGGA